MGSKKHKKESKKKKHRSRSRSPLDGGEERERKRHKKHKDRKKERSPDVEEVPVDSHLKDNGAARSYSHSPTEELELAYEREREREHRRRHREESHESERHERHKERGRELSPPPPPAISGAAGQDSLSIDETNRLRAKLGLKPLEVNEAPAEDGKFKDDLGEFYHKPAANIAQQKKTEKIREKLEERKEKRKLEKKLQVQTLGEGSDEEDAAAWVVKSREIEKQKQEAAKRAAMLDEMDEVFGVSALVAEDARESRQLSYPARALRGLRVAHDLDAIGDERETILTLADAEVLAEGAEDVLVNVNLVDDERYKKNIEERKKARVGYQAYDDEADLEAAALGFQRPVLAKYDAEIDKEKAAREKGFIIGDDDAIEAKKFRDMMRRERQSGGPGKRLESLALPAPRVASEYLDDRELAKFKTTKKKGKIRKKAKEEPIDVDDYEAGTAPLLTDDTDVKPDSLGVLAVDDPEIEPDGELQAALARARRLRYLEQRDNRGIPKVEEILEAVKEEAGAEAEAADGAMVLDATAEFCRTLGDIPTYGLAGNRHAKQDILDFERDMEVEVEPAAESAAGAWSRVDLEQERPPDLVAGSSVGLEAEPALGAGVAGALALALSKGYLERADAAPAPRPHHAHLLHAAHYSIEDKSSHPQEDDKYGRRGGGHGPLVDFREKAGFRPAVKLEYVDDEGRPLCPKEAFRYLSHKFHGKGPGKNKQEKRIKKQIQEGLMKKMSSTDTPLGTLQMLQEKQRETHKPYIVLSGAKREPHN